MAFFEKIGKSANNMFDSTKINNKINAQRSAIKKLYFEIGEKVYTEYDEKGEVDNNLMELCDQIKQANDSIAEHQETLLEISGKRLCTQCNKEIEKDAGFCPHCGGKQDE